MKILPKSDQFNITMFENMCVKHKPSNLGHTILIKGTLREIDITLKIKYSTDFHHLYNHSIHHSLTTHLHSGTVAVPVRSLSGSIFGIIGMISVIPFHSMRAVPELQKKSMNSGIFFLIMNSASTNIEINI